MGKVSKSDRKEDDVFENLIVRLLNVKMTRAVKLYMLQKCTIDYLISSADCFKSMGGEKTGQFIVRHLNRASEVSHFECYKACEGFIDSYRLYMQQLRTTFDRYWIRSFFKTLMESVIVYSEFENYQL
jgi:hypothetical protein